MTKEYISLMAAPANVTMISEYLYAALVLKNGETLLATKPGKSTAPALLWTPSQHARTWRICQVS